MLQLRPGIPNIYIYIYAHTYIYSLLIYLFLAVLGLPCCAGFSLVAASEGYSVDAVCGLLIAVASIVAEHRLQATRPSVVAVPRL